MQVHHLYSYLRLPECRRSQIIRVGRLIAAWRDSHEIRILYKHETRLPPSPSLPLPPSLTSSLFLSRGASDKAVCYDYGAGSEQAFSEENEVIHPGDLSGEGNRYDPANGKNTVPLAILMETDDGKWSE